MHQFAYLPYFRYRRKKGLLRTQKGVFACSLKKQLTRKTCNLRTRKGVFASQVQLCRHAKGAICIRKNGEKEAFAMPWHRVGQRYACYTLTRNAPGSNPTHSKLETCVYATEERKKLKRLMIKSKIQPEEPQTPKQAPKTRGHHKPTSDPLF